MFLVSGQLAIFAGFFGNVASAAPAQGSPQRFHATTGKPLTHQLSGPDLGVSVTTGAASYNVGSTVSYTLTINNAASADPILLGTPVTFTDLAALGLSNVAVTATSGWSFSVSSATSPSLITGTYTGVYPIAAGQTLPSITVTGIANGQVLGLLANVATVTVLGDLNLSNNSATVDVSIVNAPTPTVPVPSVTATVAVPSVTSTVTVPSVTATVAVPSVTSTVPVPSVTATVAVPSVTSTVAVPSVTATVAVPSVTSTVAVPTVTTTVTVPTATTTVTVPTLTATVPVPSVTATVTAPDLNISQTITGGTTFQVGQTINYALQIGDSPTAGPVVSPNPVTVTEVIPLGFTNLTAGGTGWNITLSSTTSPALLTATYTGTYPINAGVALSPINISGIATVNGIPSITTSANVSTIGDLNLLDNTSTATVTITNPLTPTATVTAPTATATVTVPSVTATVVPTLTTTVTVPTVTTTVTVPTLTATVTVPSVTATVAPTVTTTVTVPTATATIAVPTLTSTVTVPSVTTTVTVPTATATVTVPSVTATVTAPYLTLGQTVIGGLTYQVGQTVNYSLQANVGINGGAETIPNSITVSEVLPLGFTNVAASGTNWSITLSDTTSPAVLTAVYNGQYPVAAGTSLPPIAISGTLTVDAIPLLTTTATVSSLDNIDVLNNSATATILVSAGVSTPTATTTVTVPTATTTVTVPSVTATVAPTLTTTITVPSVTATVAPTLTTTVTVPTLTATIPVPSVTTTVTVPTVTVTVPVPSVTATVVPTLTATPTLPDVSIALTNQGGTTFQVGQTVTYNIQVTNRLDSGNLARTIKGYIPLGVRSIATAKANTPILVTAVLPLGLSNIVTSGTGWNITNSASISPSAITAQYNGTYPIVPGQNLPVITISGTLTSSAGPIFTTQAALLVPGNINTTTVTSVDSVTVQPAATPTTTATVTIPTPTVTTTVTVPTPTATITVPTVTATVPVPSVTATVTIPTPTVTIPVPSVTATVSVPTPTATIPVPSVTATTSVPTPTTTPVLNPDLSISATLVGNVNAQVGQTVTYNLQVSDAANAGAVVTAHSINLTDILPLGLNGIQVTGTGWQINTSSTISPAVVTAIYTGDYPVLPGASLPVLTITGTLASTAVPSFTTTASVNVPGDTNYANNLATVTVLVSSALTPTVTATAVPTVTATATSTVIPTSTVTVPTITATAIPTSTISVPTLTPTIIPTSTVFVPTATPTTVPTITPTPGIDLGITQNVQGGISTQVGRNAIFALQVQNVANAGAVTRPDSIIATDILPLGLNGVQAAGNNWIISTSSTTSPTVITAVYNGAYPVLPGTILPPIIVTGVLNSNAVPMFTSTASVNIPNDINYANNLAVSTIAVSSLPTPTATVPVPTPTVTLPSHLLMSISSPDVSNLTVGQNANYSLVVSNLTNAGPVQSDSTIRVHDLLPLGLSNISASGNGWTITTTGTTGPVMLTAIYTGTYPVLPGTSLPPIVITGTVTSNAVPTLTDVASVTSTGNNNAANNTALLTLPVFLP